MGIPHAARPRRKYRGALGAARPLARGRRENVVANSREILPRGSSLEPLHGVGGLLCRPADGLRRRTAAAPTSCEEHTQK